VDLEGGRPLRVGAVQACAAADTGVGEVEVDGAEGGFRGRDQLCDHLGVGGVAAGGDRGVADLVRDLRRGGGVEVGDDDLRAVAGEPAGQCRADTGAAAGDDGGPAGEGVGCCA